MRSKNTAFLGMVILAASFNAGSALANDGTCGNESVPGMIFCSAMLVTSSPLASTIGLIESTTGQNKEALVGQIREDSAEFVGAEGLEPPSAFLNEALQSARANTPAAAKMTDLQIAEILLSAPDQGK